jgi:hypothetical protein
VSESDLGQVLARAEDSFDRATSSRALVARSVDRADRVLAQINDRDGAVRDARRRELRRLNQTAGKTLVRIGIAVSAISLAAIAIGLIVPIGMFGFLAAVGLAVGVAAVLAFSGGRQALAPPVAIPAALPNGELVQRFDSYLYRSRALLPAPAQAQIDQISARLTPLRETLERVEMGDPAAQDARRLMQVHLPGLIDRYLNVPKAYRSEKQDDGVSADDRLVEALSASRQALDEMGETLAKNDLLAFETQGRFLESRYKDPGSIN